MKKSEVRDKLIARSKDILQSYSVISHIDKAIKDLNDKVVYNASHLNDEQVDLIVGALFILEYNPKIEYTKEGHVFIHFKIHDIPLK